MVRELMDMYHTSVEKNCFDDLSDIQDEEIPGNPSSLEEPDSQSVSPKSAMEQEKRIRREIANSNERRRMQSINAGFQSLRALLPQREGEKLSKAAILQQTSDHIYTLEQDKTRLLTQNCQLKRLLGQQPAVGGADSDTASSPASSRRNTSQESVAEELRPASAPAAASPPTLALEPASVLEPLRLELLELRSQLEQEQQQRVILEERLLEAEARPQLQSVVYAEHMEHHEQPHAVSHQVHMHFKKPRLEAPPPADDRLTPPSPPSSSQTVLPSLLVTEQEEELPLPTAPLVQHRPLYVSSTTSRQNLDTIVEAIRHLEGEHLFREMAEAAAAAATATTATPAVEETRLHVAEPQDAPLELTTHARAADPYRPGVIVAQQQQHHQHHQHQHQLQHVQYPPLS